MKLTVTQVDALQELINIGVGRAAGVLNDMIGSPLRLHVPYVRLLSLVDLQPELKKRFNGETIAVVRLKFSGSFTGTSELIFPKESASNLVALLTGEVPGTPDLDSVRIGTLLEVGNIVLNGVMGSLSNVLIQRLDYSLPTYCEEKADSFLISKQIDGFESILLAHTRFIIEELQVIGDIILVFKVGSLETLMDAIHQTFEGV